MFYNYFIILTGFSAFYALKIPKTSFYFYFIEIKLLYHTIFIHDIITHIVAVFPDHMSRYNLQRARRKSVNLHPYPGSLIFCQFCKQFLIICIIVFHESPYLPGIFLRQKATISFLWYTIFLLFPTTRKHFQPDIAFLYIVFRSWLINCLIRLTWF